MFEIYLWNVTKQVNLKFKLKFKVYKLKSSITLSASTLKTYK